MFESIAELIKSRLAAEAKLETLQDSKTLSKLTLQVCLNPSVNESFFKSYLNEYVDLQILLFKSLETNLEQVSASQVYELLCALKPASNTACLLLSEDNDDCSEDGKESPMITTFKQTFQMFIVSFLGRAKMPESLLKKFLLQAPKSVLPNMENPLFLSDFLTSCLDHEQLLEV